VAGVCRNGYICSVQTNVFIIQFNDISRKKLPSSIILVNVLVYVLLLLSRPNSLYLNELAAQGMVMAAVALFAQNSYSKVLPLRMVMYFSLTFR
jgi:hypothetical protein